MTEQLRVSNGETDNNKTKSNHYYMKKHIAGSILSVALLGAAAQAQSTIIYDSLSDRIFGVGPVGVNSFFPPPMNGDNLRAQSFTTGDEAFTLDSVALSLEPSSGTGGFTVSLYDDSGNQPGTLLATLAGNDSPGAGLEGPGGSLYTYTGSLDLSLDTTYWVVADVSADYAGNIYGWDVGNAGTTVGSTVGAGYSSDGSASWGLDNSSSYLMQVTAGPTIAATPEPSTVALAATGGLGMLMMFRRRK
jgi:hypothetical protein